MYKINQFSKLSGLTVKALRYYDQENILKPTIRKVENLYRYYTDEDLKKAQCIKLLRTLDFSIREIKEVLYMVDDDSDISCILHEKIKQIETHMAKEKELINKLHANITLCTLEQHQKTYAIDLVDVAAISVASIRFQGSYHDLDTYVPKLYKAVKNQVNGHHFNCYYNEGCVEKADIEVCLPIKQIIYDENITCKQLPKIKALRTIHYGGYDTLYLAYRALFAHVNTQGFNIVLPTREIYIKGPGMLFKGNPAKYVTEIYLPLENSKGVSV